MPNISLSGRVFREASCLDDLGGALSYWSVLGSVFQPIFEGGRIIKESEARQVEAKAAVYDLHRVVLQALNEVEEALTLEHSLAAQALALESAQIESAKSSAYYEQRYKQGLDTLQSFLLAKEQEMAVRHQLIEVRARRMENRVNLALASGCGLERQGSSDEGDA